MSDGVALNEEQTLSKGSQQYPQQDESVSRDSPCTFVPLALQQGLIASIAQDVPQGATSMAMPTDVPPTFEAETPPKTQLRDNAEVGKPYRLIYDLQFCSRKDDMPGVLARSEGQKALNVKGDPSVDLCYDNFGIAYDFFYKVFGRNSIDGQGCPLIGIVNFDFYYANATYSFNETTLEHVLVFGNGWDNDAFTQGAPMQTFAGMFGGFVGSLEVIVHEMMHGITRTEIKLASTKDPGALDEHISDVFGVMAEQWHKKQTVEEADWLVGEDCLLPERKGFAMKSISNPGTAYDFQIDNESFRGFSKDPQVACCKDAYDGIQDRGGVHRNSGIPNRAFYLVAKKLGGHAWEKAGQIWYSVLTSGEVPTNCSFSRWAKHTMDAAAKNPDLGGKVADLVEEAWKEVGVKPRW